MENSHLNWENGAVSGKKKKKKLFIAFFFRDGFSSRAVSAVKSLKLFQSWGTSHGYYPSPP
jgi:hypothetical protein